MMQRRVGVIGGGQLAWMTTEGVDLKSIGLFSLVALPYSLKFFWSPLLDRYVPPLLGRRRGWILIAQICLTLAIGFMGLGLLEILLCSHQ